jgi:hypothetical protein
MLRKPLVILAWPVGDTLAAHIADVFDEVRPPQKDVDPPLTIEPCSHRPAEYLIRCATEPIIVAM